MVRVCVLLLHGAMTWFICFIGTAAAGNKTKENAKEEEEEEEVEEEAQKQLVSMQDVGSSDYMSAFSGKGKGKWSEDRKGKWNDEPQNCYNCGGAYLRLLKLLAGVRKVR